MGRTYAYVLVTTAARADDALAGVAASLVSTDRERLLSALPWMPTIDRLAPRAGGGSVARDRRGIRGISLTEHEHDNYYCFTFAVEPDEVLRKWVSACFEALPLPELEYIKVGCVWTSIRAGDALFTITAEAATSDMSELFQYSEGIRNTWLRIATEIGATALFFDDESDKWAVLYPSTGTVRSPGEEEQHYFVDTFEIVVDSYYSGVLHLAGLLEEGGPTRR